MVSFTKSSWISWRLLNRVGLLAPRPTPIPEYQASLFISPRGRVATHFSRLLRHAWVTVGLYLFPGHHTGSLFLIILCNFSLFFKADISHWVRSKCDTVCEAVKTTHQTCATKKTCKVLHPLKKHFKTWNPLFPKRLMKDSSGGGGRSSTAEYTAMPSPFIYAGLLVRTAHS
jgi:hypothetical protein